MLIVPTIEAANIGMADSLVLMVLALVVFGPRRLPKIGRQIGKLMYEFRKASNDFKFQMEEEMRNAEDADRRKREEDERQRALAAAPPAQIEASSQVAETASAESGVAEGAAELAPESDAETDEYDRYDAEDFDPPSEEPEPEETHLRVHPPATGAPVAAERPTSRAMEVAGAPAAATEEAAAEAIAPGEEAEVSGETQDAHEFVATDETATVEATMDEVAVTSAAPEVRKLPADEPSSQTEPAVPHG
ncbi:MAG: Sec-independent protein translocase subunit TatA/TatB [Terracidiphilus sp.]